jgi:hypothetical protein
MRLFQFIVASLVVVAGLIGGLLLVTFGFVLFVFRRLFGRPAARPRFQRSFRPAATRPAYANRDDVIDVVTTPAKD